MKQVFKGIVKTEEGNHVFNDVSEYNKFVQTLIDKGLNFECETKSFTIDEQQKLDEQKELLDLYGLTRNEGSKIVATPYYESGEPYYGEDDVNRVKGRMGAFMKYLPHILEKMDNNELGDYYEEVHEIINMLEDDIDEAKNDINEINNDLDDMLARLDKLGKEHDDLIDQVNHERDSREEYKDQLDSAEELKAFYKRIERAIVDAGVNLSKCECKKCKNCDGQCNCNKNSCKKYDKTDGDCNRSLIDIIDDKDDLKHCKGCAELREKLFKFFKFAMEVHYSCTQEQFAIFYSNYLYDNDYFNTRKTNDFKPRMSDMTYNSLAVLSAMLLMEEDVSKSVSDYINNEFKYVLNSIDDDFIQQKYNEVIDLIGEPCEKGDELRKIIEQYTPLKFRVVDGDVQFTYKSWIKNERENKVEESSNKAEGSSNEEGQSQDNTYNFECSIEKSAKEIADLITNLFKESDKERLENDGKSLKSDKLSKALEGYEKLLKEIFE